MEVNKSQNQDYNDYSRRIVVDDFDWTTRDTCLAEDFLIDYCAYPDHQYNDACINIGCAKFKSELYRRLDLIKAAKVVITYLSKHKDKLFYNILLTYINENKWYEEYAIDKEIEYKNMFRALNDRSYHDVKYEQIEFSIDNNNNLILI